MTMPEETLVACGACGNRVHSTDQRTCPHCLETLRAKRFRSRASLEAFQADRAEHGAQVEPVSSKPKRGAAMALAFSGVLMLTAGAGILLGGLRSGGALGLTSAVGDALLPLALAAALFAVAGKVGGWMD